MLIDPKIQNYFQKKSHLQGVLLLGRDFVNLEVCDATPVYYYVAIETSQV